MATKNPEQLEFSLIVHMIDTQIIGQRASDGYVNATAMCRAVGKKINDYARLGTTKEFLDELSAVTGIPATGLVVIIQGGTPDQQGTWVHPDVAINLAQWCSPKFAVAVSQWVREWSSGRAKPVGMPYHIKRYVANRGEIPTTHFSMLNEMLFSLIAPLESDGYTMPDSMIPDISTGLMFCKWLREVKNIDTDALPTYRHIYEDGRVVMPKLYPNEVLADFRKYFNDVWLPKKAATYFSDRDPKALPHLPRLLPSPTAQAKSLPTRSLSTAPQPKKPKKKS